LFSLRFFFSKSSSVYNWAISSSNVNVGAAGVVVFVAAFGSVFAPAALLPEVVVPLAPAAVAEELPPVVAVEAVDVFEVVAALSLDVVAVVAAVDGLAGWDWAVVLLVLAVLAAVVPAF
jgi:hypothetical protein